MKLIPLSQFKKCKNRELNLFAQVDDTDYEWLMKWRWQAQKEKHSDKHYAVAAVNGKLTKMHRLIMGVTDPKITIDHIDRNTLNNQTLNLRKATPLQQSWNRGNQKNTLSKFKGVSIIRIYKRKLKDGSVNIHVYKNPFSAKIRLNGKLIS